MFSPRSKNQRHSTLKAGASQNSVFPDVPTAWKALSCLSAQPVCLSDAVWTLWAVLQRHPTAVRCNCTHIWRPRPTHCYPASSTQLFFFLASANYKHMRPCGSTDCCQTSRLLFPLSSALWHAGRFMLSPKKALNAVLRFLLNGPQQAAQLGNYD